MSTEQKPFGVHEGGCHCGYITYSMKLSPPLEEYTVLNCNCSICRRAGYLLVCKYSGDKIERLLMSSWPKSNFVTQLLIRGET